MANASEGTAKAEDRLLPRTHGISNGPQFVGMGWRSLPVPVIAVVHGVAFGDGQQVAVDDTAAALLWPSRRSNRKG
jgi:enoyl-CoA hydratase/carnithine racemase